MGIFRENYGERIEVNPYRLPNGCRRPYRFFRLIVDKRP
ncbi:hypothetical protein NBRC111894_2438 [Sporolactobacillus inulinus]|uniref:Uncharacterized protein n=1 Tax=Sporolactobacillus inulinus TaxID=2078 RepID=A0A4Y1ZCW8_9BACL|nr:hypothetical protein NBRC111894_2438 [Sporolactobacillus inulinus]